MESFEEKTSMTRLKGKIAHRATVLWPLRPVRSAPFNVFFPPLYSDALCTVCLNDGHPERRGSRAVHIPFKVPENHQTKKYENKIRNVTKHMGSAPGKRMQDSRVLCFKLQRRGDVVASSY